MCQSNEFNCRVDPDIAAKDLLNRSFACFIGAKDNVSFPYLSPCEMALKKAEDGLKTKDLQILNVFAELTEMKMKNKLGYIELVMKYGTKEWISFEGFKKQLSSLSAAEVAASMVFED